MYTFKAIHNIYQLPIFPQDHIEDSKRPHIYNYQYAKWQEMCFSIHAVMEQEIVHTKEAIRHNPHDNNSKDHLTYLEQTFNILHEEAVRCEEMFVKQIINDDVANFFMLSNAVMNRTRRSYAHKRLVERTAPDEAVDWDAFLVANTIRADPSDEKWVTLGWGLLKKLVDDVKSNFVRIEMLCKNVVLIDEFWFKNKDKLKVDGDRVILDLITILSTNKPRDVDAELSTRDLEHDVSMALAVGQRRCGEC